MQFLDIFMKPSHERPRERVNQGQYIFPNKVYSL